ncbi:hypothetical protein HOLleu_10098 [Holothuria leucospilota]|uniref:G-protein coupled receptors family 1 profile domain-containing protein n=1 Tax=Holothuria leucospilota TaxID=206669 RepID=A0A9Q1CDV4_HOLLE|nr:hypothetical protein HOLleu_10098 [Holothuria leucospilota]
MSTTTTQLLPFPNFTNTSEDNTTYQTEPPQEFFPPALPPGWTYEGILYLSNLLKVRLGLSVAALLANSIVFLLQLKLKSFQKTHFIFGTMLSVTEALYGCGVFMETYSYINNIRPVPVVYGALTLATHFQSYLAIVAVALDRYLALCAFPLKYKFLVTPKKYVLVIAVMCVLSTGYSFFFTRFFPPDHPLITLRTFVVPTTLVCITSLIYVILAISMSRSYKGLQLPPPLKKARVRQTKRLMFAFGLILLTNAVCVLPQRGFLLYIFFQPDDRKLNIFRHVVIGNWLYNLQTLNSILNPIIYWWQVLIREISSPCRKNNKGLSTKSAHTDISSLKGDRSTKELTPL